jgi:hypothetical protein
MVAIPSHFNDDAGDAAVIFSCFIAEFLQELTGQAHIDGNAMIFGGSAKLFLWGTVFFIRHVGVEIGRTNTGVHKKSTYALSKGLAR